jgi:hypothetical protein
MAQPLLPTRLDMVGDVLQRRNRILRMWSHHLGGAAVVLMVSGCSNESLSTDTPLFGESAQDDGCADLNQTCERLRAMPLPPTGTTLEPYKAFGPNKYDVVLAACADAHGLVLTTLEHRLEDMSWFRLPATPNGASVTVTLLAQGDRTLGAFVYRANSQFHRVATPMFPQRARLSWSEPVVGKLVPPHSYQVYFAHTEDLEDVYVDFFVDDHPPLTAAIGSTDPRGTN